MRERPLPTREKPLRVSRTSTYVCGSQQTKQFGITGIIYFPPGRVKKWEYSYGFIEISEPKEHRKAGTIFAHISDFKNRDGTQLDEITRYYWSIDNE